MGHKHDSQCQGRIELHRARSVAEGPQHWPGMKPGILGSRKGFTVDTEGDARTSADSITECTFFTIILRVGKHAHREEEWAHDLHANMTLDTEKPGLSQ